MTSEEKKLVDSALMALAANAPREYVFAQLQSLVQLDQQRKAEAQARSVRASIRRVEKEREKAARRGRRRRPRRRSPVVVIEREAVPKAPSSTWEE